MGLIHQKYKSINKPWNQIKNREGCSCTKWNDTVEMERRGTMDDMCENRHIGLKLQRN